MSKNQLGKIELKTGRIEALSDGIFAIAMTILVLSFDIPPKKFMDESALLRALIGLWPDFLHYVESFIILGVFWLQHHYQFHMIKRTDSVLIILNIFGLMFIAMIPFSTAVMGDHGHSFFAALLSNLNLLAAGLLFYLHWFYATQGRRLVDPDMDIRVIRFYRHRNLVIPVTAVIVIILSFFSPRWSTLVYFAVPLFLVLYKK